MPRRVRSARSAKNKQTPKQTAEAAVVPAPKPRRRVTRSARRARIGEALLAAIPDKTSLLLAYLDTSEIIRMALMNTEWQTKVFSGGAQLWSRIKFPAAAALRLDDTGFLSFLRKIDAKHHTVSLSLVGCVNVHFSHMILAHIVHLKKLVELDLRVEGESYVGPKNGRLDASVLGEYFTNCVGRASFTLEKLHLTRARNTENHFECYDDDFYVVMVCMAHATARRHRRVGTRCGECGAGACDAFPTFRDGTDPAWVHEEDPNFMEYNVDLSMDEGIPYELCVPNCDRCGEFKCGRAPDSHCDTMSTCRDCRVTLCSGCDHSGGCDICHRSGCSECVDSTPCDICTSPAFFNIYLVYL